MTTQTTEDALMEALQAIRARLIQHDKQITTLAKQLGEVTDLMRKFAQLAGRYMDAK